MEETKLTTEEIKKLLASEIELLSFTPETAPDNIYYKACASLARKIMREKCSRTSSAE